MQKSSYCKSEDGTDEYDARQIGEIPVEHILKHVGTGRRMKCIVQWNRCGKDGDTLEPPLHIPQYFIARYWSILNRRKAQKWQY